MVKQKQGQVNRPPRPDEPSREPLLTPFGRAPMLGRALARSSRDPRIFLVRHRFS